MNAAPAPTAVPALAPTLSTAADASVLVVDCSVVINALLGNTDAAIMRQLGERTLAVPALLDYEVLSALRRLVAREQLAASAASEALGLFSEMHFERHGPNHMRARMWALRHSITPHDAAYVALAEALGVPLITADLRLAKSAAQWCSVIVG